MKILIYLLLILTTINSNGYAQDIVRKVLFEETFDSNKNYWTKKNDWKRQITINNGLLIDHNTHYGYRSLNAIPVNIVAEAFDNTEEHIITFKIANLNNKDGLMYGAYKDKKDGSQGKLEYIKNTTYSILWGYKDWSNYNALDIITVENPGLETRCRAYSVVNGNEILHEDWSYESKLDKETGYNTISLRKTNSYGYFVYLDGYSHSKQIPDLTIDNSEWYGDQVGIAVEPGAKVAFDNLKIEKVEWKWPDPVNPADAYGFVTFRNIIEDFNKNAKLPSYITTEDNGNRVIYCEILDTKALESDQTQMALQLATFHLDYMFSQINYNRAKPITLQNLIDRLKDLNISNYKLKTQSQTVTVSWEQVVEFRKEQK